MWEGEREQDILACLQVMELSVEALRQGIGKLSGRGNGQHPGDWQSKEYQCILFNQSSCYFQACHFRHACIICQAPHPTYLCTRPQGGGPRVLTNQEQWANLTTDFAT